MIRSEDQREAEAGARILAAIANVHRLKIMMLLQKGEMSVGQLAREISITQGGTSQFLEILRAYGIVARRREGQRTFYRLKSFDAASIVNVALKQRPVKVRKWIGQSTV